MEEAIRWHKDKETGQERTFTAALDKLAMDNPNEAADPLALEDEGLL